MGLLEQITQMKSQGIPEEEIITQLQEKGIAPKEINNALNQLQIKNAVANANESGDTEQNIIEPQSAQKQSNQNIYTPKIQEYSEGYAPQQNYSQTQEYYPQEEYEGYAPTEGGTNTDMIIEISEQVFAEKTKLMQKQIEQITEFMNLAQTKIQHNSERLKRIETTIDKLQIAILEKIGSYGNNLSSIKKEMAMMQNSFGKVVNAAVSHAKKKHSTHKKTSKKE